MITSLQGSIAVVTVFLLVYLLSLCCTHPKYAKPWRMMDLEEREMTFISYDRNFPPEGDTPFPMEFLPYIWMYNINDDFYYTDSKYASDEVVFATYASPSTFDKSRAFIRELRHKSSNKIIIYDLGLNFREVFQMQQVSNLEIRKFAFGFFPEYLKKLEEYRFRPIILAELFHEFEAFWLLDPSVRFASHFSKAMDEFYEAVRYREIEPFVMRLPTGHSIYEATDSMMTKYLPIKYDRFKSTEMMKASAVFVRQNEFARQVVKWNVLCALTEDCMCPHDAILACRIAGDRNVSAGCHSYDESALNIILTSLFERDRVYTNISRSNRLFTKLFKA